MPALHTTTINSLPLVGRGKVRDIYAIDDENLLFIQTDRISAFDVVMNEPIPGKGDVLTEMSHFWFSRFESTIAHHLSDQSPADLPLSDDERQQTQGRAMVVKKLNPLPIEAVCRGYLIGSGWKEYTATGAVCGETLPPGLRLAEKLPEVIFTPATKAPPGEHDVNISYQEMANHIGSETAKQVKDATLSLYEKAAAYALERGIIIADTKFEFALDDNGTLVLIDEVLTPDSSRFWSADDWQAGVNPESFDKQYIRDWLETTSWDKTPPPPTTPPEVIAATAQKYEEIKKRLVSAE